MESSQDVPITPTVSTPKLNKVKVIYTPQVSEIPISREQIAKKKDTSNLVYLLKRKTHDSICLKTDRRGV